MGKQDENKIQLPERYSRKELNKLYREIPLTDNAFRTQGGGHGFFRDHGFAG